MTYHPLMGTPASQRGATLLTALIILVVLTLISLASLNTSLLELRMASNEESTMKALQAAQAAADYVVEKADQNFVVTGTLGYTNCTTNKTGCDETAVTLVSPPFDGGNGIVITRITEEGCIPNTSCDKVKGAAYSINSTFDKSSLGLGKGEIVQGYVKMFPCVSQCGGNNPISAAHN